MTKKNLSLKVPYYHFKVLNFLPDLQMEQHCTITKDLHIKQHSFYPFSLFLQHPVLASS